MAIPDTRSGNEWPYVKGPACNATLFCPLTMAYLRSLITKLQVPDPLILIGVATLLYWLVVAYYRSEARKLRQFPTVGSTLPLLSLIGTFNYATNPHAVIAAGRRKWPGLIFKVPVPTGWHLVITNPTLVDDIRKAPNHKLSTKKAIEESLQTRFTFGRQIMENQIHIPIIKTQLTRAVPELVPDVYDEMIDACNQYLPAKEDWSSVKPLETMIQIVARTSNRVFVGPILCKNPEWTKLSIEFAIDVAKNSTLLNFCPPFMRPFVNYFASRNVAQRNRDGLRLLGPVIAACRNESKEDSYSPNAFLSWIIDEEKEDWAILERIFAVNFAAIHTTSLTVSHVLLDLATNQEYVTLLREEVEEVTKREGWTKAGLDRMHKVDSFVKESQRLHPIGILMSGRYVVDDYTFSDGTTVPAGSIVGVPSTSVHLDPHIYEDPLKFDGFRFLKMKEGAAHDSHIDKKFDMVTVNPEFMAFGQGKHGCPGRFFAAAKIKLLLAHIVTTYDVKLASGNERPSDICYMNSNFPNLNAMISFRKRQ